jgi:hypothetical protein
MDDRRTVLNATELRLGYADPFGEAFLREGPAAVVRMEPELPDNMSHVALLKRLRQRRVIPEGLGKDGRATVREGELDLTSTVVPVVGGQETSHMWSVLRLGQCT